MTRPTFLSTLFPDGKPLFFSAALNGKPYTRHWAVLEKEDETGYAFKFLLELDPRVIGQGKSIIRQTCRLELDAALAPIRYQSEAQGARVVLEIGADKITAIMPDRSKPEVARGGAEFIVEANITGLDAIMWARLHEQGRLPQEAQEGAELGLTLFLLNKLIALPYKLTAAGPGQYKSNYEELITIGADGLLQSVQSLKQGVKTERLEAPPLPDWDVEKPAGPPREFHKYRPRRDHTFKLEDISISAPAGPVGATLTIPRGEGPFPAVLFLSGTGTHDRHGVAGEVDIGSHEIVDFLSEHGFVGLRFDTRGAGTTQRSNTITSSLKPVIEDAVACLTYLRNRPEVDAKRCVLIGHSQGGVIAMTLAAETRDPPIRGIALLASLGRPIDEVLEQQVLGQSRALGLTEEQQQSQLKDFREFVAAVRAGKKFAPGEVADYLMVFARTSEWLKEHLEAAPADLMAKVRCPVLVCQGAKDFQVTVEDAKRLDQAARQAGLDVELEIFPDLDHLFKVVTGVSRLEQYYETRPVDLPFLERLHAWLQKVS